MELNGISLTFVFIFFQELLEQATAATCSYISSNGLKRYTFCMQKCCEKNERSYSSVCCPYADDKEVYMGAGMATLIVMSVFAICFTYVCCKNRMRRARQSAGLGRHRQRSRSREERNQDVIPAVSLHVEPIQPPAYDALPPPYYTLEAGTSNKKEELPHSEFGPPPAYTP